MKLDNLFQLLHEQRFIDAEATSRRYGSTGTAVAISACLMGMRCRYDATDRDLGKRLEKLGDVIFLPVCPEVLAGLGTPRPPMVFTEGDGEGTLTGTHQLVDAKGRDCSARMREAAELALKLALAAGCKQVILKERSPSCGVHQVHTKAGLISGRGIFTAVCLRSGLTVTSDEDL